MVDPPLVQCEQTHTFAAAKLRYYLEGGPALSLPALTQTLGWEVPVREH